MLEQLLNKNLTRLEILKSESDKKILKTVHISVYRNHSFEHMTGMINKFLNQTGLTAEFSFSDYDDSFNFAPLSTKNDLNLIWIDFSRYSQIDINTWFNDRINSLKTISKKPIFVYYTGADSVRQNNKDVVMVNSNDIEIVTEEELNQKNASAIDDEVLKKTIISDMSNDIVAPATNNIVE